MRARFRASLALSAVLLILSSACVQREPKLVPVSEIRPSMTYQNTSPRFRLKVFMYAPGNLLFQVENLIPEFHLAGLPEIASPTGRILQTRLAGEETIEFNLILPDDAYVRSANDVTIPWILNEKGPGGFLRSEGEILVDIARTLQASHLVKSVTYRPLTDESAPPKAPS